MDLVADRFDLAGVEAEVVDQALRVELDRVALRPLLVEAVGHVAHVVVGAVAVHAHRAALDQGRAAALTRALDRYARGLEHGLDVVAVHRDAGEPVGARALDRVDSELELVRGRVGEAVVLEDEDDRQALDAGHVHRLVPLAVGGRAFAEVGHGHALL